MGTGWGLEQIMSGLESLFSRLRLFLGDGKPLGGSQQRPLQEAR